MSKNGQRLRRAAARLSSHQSHRLFWAAFANGLGVALILLAILLAFDRLAPGSDASRSSAFVPLLIRGVGFAVFAALPIAFLVAWYVQRRPALRDLEESARRSEQESEVLRDRLVPALQVMRTRGEERTGYSADLIDAVVDETVEVAEKVEPKSLPGANRSKAKRMAKRISATPSPFANAAQNRR